MNKVLGRGSQKVGFRRSALEGHRIRHPARPVILGTEKLGYGCNNCEVEKRVVFRFR